jgi:hypothetical protein
MLIIFIISLTIDIFSSLRVAYLLIFIKLESISFALFLIDSKLIHDGPKIHGV